MADGGDGYTCSRECTHPLGGDVDLDAFARYLEAHAPVAPPALNRIDEGRLRATDVGGALWGAAPSATIRRG